MDLTTLDLDAVTAFAEKVGVDQAITYGTAMAYVGGRLGLWAALAEAGPVTSEELARRTGLAEAGDVRDRHRDRLPGRRLGRHPLLRRPARHGRPARRRAVRPQGGGRRRHRGVHRARGRRPVDRLEDNLHPIGLAYYATSTALRVPGALSQAHDHDHNQAGTRRIAEVLAQAGFTQVRAAARTPFHLVIEARP
jgi:hypothetical protein